MFQIRKIRLLEWLPTRIYQVCFRHLELHLNINQWMLLISDVPNIWPARYSAQEFGLCRIFGLHSVQLRGAGYPISGKLYISGRVFDIRFSRYRIIGYLAINSQARSFLFQIPLVHLPFFFLFQIFFFGVVLLTGTNR